MGVKAFFLVGRKLVSQSGRRGEARQGAQEGQEREEDQHIDSGRREHSRVGCRGCSVDAGGGIDTDGQWSSLVVVWSLDCEESVSIASCCRMRPRIRASREMSMDHLSFLTTQAPVSSHILYQTDFYFIHLHQIIMN